LTTITLTLNGEATRLDVEPHLSLADAIRRSGLTGTHVGCEHGVCGACTVIVDGAAIRACLMFAVQADGAAIRTVEGLADGAKLHPLQEAFIAHHALQCGYCTPGFLMLATAALEADPDLDVASIRDLVSSNLCRCTGYQTIIDAIAAAATTMRQER
jgi:carbon-monoxide dehydrogenase small subunit